MLHVACPPIRLIDYDLNYVFHFVVDIESSEDKRWSDCGMIRRDRNSAMNVMNVMNVIYVIYVIYVIEECWTGLSV